MPELATSSSQNCSENLRPYDSCFNRFGLETPWAIGDACRCAPIGSKAPVDRPPHTVGGR
eukprot:6205407-Pleurochrysis_carterae.AAC.1